jgi:hypothetical protein
MVSATKGATFDDIPKDAQTLLKVLNASHKTGTVPGWLQERINADKRQKQDPARQVPGMPPNFGNMPLPHVLTFQGLFGTFSRVYRASDEALKDSRDVARYMRNDPIIMECVESRQRSTALLGWHLTPEDESSHDQMDLCKQIEKVLRRMRRFTEYRRCLLEAIWYGRQGIQHSWNWNFIGGKKRLMPWPGQNTQEDLGWSPINGDKLVFRFDDGTTDHIPGQVGIRVGARFGPINRFQDMDDHWAQRIEPTDYGPAYFLRQYERDMLAIHKHMIEDGAYEDGIDAGTVHGVGIRSRIYWAWNQKQQMLAFLVEYLERSASGIELWYYPMGNKDALAKVEAAAKARISNQHNIAFVPRPIGEDGQAYGVEIIEPGMQGVEMLKEILDKYFGHMIKRYILGQTLSSEADATGLGSGVADLHLDTLLQIIRYDAVNLEETITYELVRRIKDWNFPSARGIDVRFTIETDEANIEEKLEAWVRAWEIGCRLKERDVMDLVGAAMPNDEDEVLENPAMAAQKEEQQMDGGDANGQHKFPDSATHQKQVMDALGIKEQPQQAMPGQPQAGPPDNKKKPGASVTGVQNGKWKTSKVPYGDTGERRRVSRRVKKLRRSGYVYSRRSAKAAT